MSYEKDNTPAKTILSAYAVCDTGCKRTNNEDLILLNDEIFRNGSRQKEFDINEKVVIALADGIGGLDNGEIASEIALTSLHKILSKIPDDLSNEELQEVFSVYTRKTHSILTGKMGSTVVGLFVYRGKVFRFHAGDSRIYLMRNGVLVRLTVDHSLRELGGNPAAPSNIMTNALGGNAAAFIEFEEIEHPLFRGDIYLLSSDGLHDLVSSPEIADILMLPSLPSSDYAEKLLSMAKRKGGWDNISIVTIKVQEQQP